MPRHMSFAHTTQQVLDRSKTVTRRLGWHSLAVGTELIAVRKSMGLKRGERVERLARIRVTDVRRERLCFIDRADVKREGFERMTVTQFVEHFCALMRCEPLDYVTRIEFEYVDD